MAELAAILNAIDFLEDHLCSPIKIADAAEAASYSLFHFCRVFSQVVRQTPYEYLMRRRLSQAALDLLKSPAKILDIALEYQFQSAAGFSRAFKRIFALQPNQIRQSNFDPRRLMPRLSIEYLEYLAQQPLIPVQEILPEIELAGLMTVCRGSSPVDWGLWGLLATQMDGLVISSELPDHFGLLLYPLRYDGQTHYYFTGIPARALSGMPAPLTLKKIPTQPVICFRQQTQSTHLSHMLAYLYHTWLPHAHITTLPEMIIQRFPYQQTVGECADILIPLHLSG